MATFLDRLRDKLAGNNDMRQIDFARDVSNSRIGFEPAYLSGLGVDGVDLPFVAVGLEVSNDDIADGELFGRGSNQGNRFRFE